MSVELVAQIVVARSKEVEGMEGGTWKLLASLCFIWRCCLEGG